MNFSGVVDNIIKIVAIIFILIAFILVNIRVNAFIKNQAIDGCAQAYRYESTLSNGAIVSYPMTELYEKCLEQKGVSVK